MPRKPLRLGLIGCGEVTVYKHLPALRRVKGVEVAAVADLDLVKAATAAERYGIPSHYPDVTSLLAGTDVDAVGVCVPPGQHADVASIVLKAGKHVWIDKPLALTSGECAGLVEAARQTRAKAMVGFHMRWHRLIRQAQSILRSGTLGRIESIRSVWNSPRSDEDLPGWRARREAGGGALIEIGVHHFDLWRFLLGAEVEQVFAASRDGVRDDESAIVAATMENGVLATATLSERTSHDIEVEICGSNGRLRLSLLRFEGLELYGARDVPGLLSTRWKRLRHFARELPTGMVSMRRGGDYRESYREAWQSFVDAIAAGETPEATLADGWRAVEILLAAAESRDTGLPVRVAHPPAAGDAIRKTPARAPGEAARHDEAGLFFSIVVPTFNRPKEVAEFLDSLCRQDYPRRRFEVILVDDGGEIPLDEAVAPYRSRLNVMLIAQENAGPANARQRGIEAASGTYLAFTDDDCRPAPDWLARLEEFCAAHPGCAVAGRTVNALTGNVYSTASQLLMGYLSRHYNSEASRTRFYPTCNLAFPRDRFQPAGGLDRRWPISGGEDRDLCYRWLKRDFQLLYYDKAVIYHCHSLTAARFCRQHFNYGRGAFRYHYLIGAGRWRKIQLEKLGFYLRLPGYAFEKLPLRRAPLQAALLALSQVVNAAGFVWESAKTLLLRSPGDLRQRAELQDSSSAAPPPKTAIRPATVRE